jgi:glycosyltransferase involved in cell wall biosynthesis
MKRVTRPVVAVVGPLTPPLHGHMVVTERVLRAARLSRDFELVHVDLSSRKDLRAIGRVGPRNVAAALRHALGLASVVVRRRPAIVYLPLAQNRVGVARDLLLLSIALAGRARVVAHVHGGGFGPFLGAQPAWFRRPAVALLRRCTLLVVMSDWQRASVEAALPGVRTAVVRHGTPAVPEARPREPSAELEVLYVTSGLVESKGFLVVLDAARLAQEAGLPFRWTVVGEWAYDRDRRHAEDRLRTLRTVRLLGRLDREALDERYAEADVFVFPTRPVEGFGLVRIEAMAAGLPVVTTEAGGAREVVRDGIDGFIVGYDDPRQLLGRLRELHEDPELRRRLGDAARLRQQELFTEDAFAEALAAIWSEALA